ncbi:recombinase family protein [Rhodohalobacter mucosus]|uniref:Resolvase n=1 Tax=Rhodohalobacter mucosus TaxID=2079485 RepID=A0A316TRH0_9BACT|nr:recombinase family protein [Rhodohalobacter mucosus]PWN05635.1 resolvase [Rhodohalobacter mucosus]
MKYVAYYRVSTKHQGAEGNGIKAQEESVNQFLKGKAAEVIDRFTEVESGTNGNRPVLKSAIQLCKDEGATLLVAKLDRLSRNVKFLFTLKEELDQAGVGFTIVDLPEANNTMVLGVMATMAQHEAEIISKRTKEGIRQSEKYQSGEWGNQQGTFPPGAREKAWAAISRKARTDTNTRHAYHFIRPLREEGQSYQSIADKLNEEGYRTRRGKKFHSAQVRKIWLRFTDSEGQSKPSLKRTPSLPEMRKAAEELNVYMGLEPPIDSQVLHRKQLLAKLREAKELIIPGHDEFTDPTQDVLDRL